jgi:hypothetical protein
MEIELISMNVRTLLTSRMPFTTSRSGSETGGNAGRHACSEGSVTSNNSRWSTKTFRDSSKGESSTAITSYSNDIASCLAKTVRQGPPSATLRRTERSTKGEIKVFTMMK